MFEGTRSEMTVATARRVTTSGPGGFTLLEILVVVVILAIAAAMAVPMLSAGGATKLQAATEMVAADLEYAKSLAISRGGRYRVTFDVAGNAYQVEDPNGAVIDHPITKGSPYAVDLDGGRLSGVEIASADFDGTAGVEFDSLGSPYDGNGDVLDSGVLTLQMGDWTRTVHVEPVTGMITVDD